MPQSMAFINRNVPVLRADPHKLKAIGQAPVKCAAGVHGEDRTEALRALGSVPADRARKIHRERVEVVWVSRNCILRKRSFGLGFFRRLPPESFD